MQIINNTNGLFENTYFQDDIIDKSIKNHKELLEIIIPKCNKVLIASPFLMDNFEYFFKNINIQNIEFELITTCNEQVVKPFQIKNFGETIKKFTKKWPEIYIINSLHSKIYLFYKDSSIISGIVTSANFTKSGLMINHETGIILSDNKILNQLEIDIKDNIKYISLSESKINDWCTIADTYKEENQYEKLEDINLGLLDTLEKNITPSTEDKNENLKEFVICTECDKEKEKVFFESSRLHKKTNYKTGICRDCVKLDKNRRDKDLEPIIRERYRNLKQKAKNHKKELSFTVAEFIEKFKNDKTFKRLYSEWNDTKLKGERNKDLKPNFYINEELDYDLNNISATTTQNIREINKKNGNNKLSTPVLQFTKDGNFIQKYNSMQIAKDKTGINTGLITKSCNEKKIVGDYIWIKEESFSQEQLDKIIQNNKKEIYN